MLFLIRAAVVIGGLSYLAMLRDNPDAAVSLPGMSAKVLPAQVLPAQVLPAQALTAHSLAAQVQPGQALAAAWDAMPADARDRMVRDGTDALVRRLGTSRSASADTLADADRRPPWRGVASR